jgi:pimeloyl-ACP methyl ester carboxylesterase
MLLGRNVDVVVGALSRFAHLRAAEHNTVDDLERHYLDLSAEEMFPEPAPIVHIHQRRTLGDRLVRASTLSWESGHWVRSPSYRARHRGPYAKNLTAWARWVRPNRRRRRFCLVYIHGWMEPGSWLEEAALFPRWSRELDVDIVHVSLPFHGKRKPGRAIFSGEYFWTADLVRSVEGVRQAVCDVRACVDWLRRQGYEQVGVSGVSLGGALAMLLACLEPVPDFIVSIVAHLELGEAIESAPIFWRMKRDLERWGVGQDERATLFRRLGISDYRPLLAPDRQLWVQAREDLYIEPDLVEKQWQAWGEPNILWIEGGHMTFALHMPEITARMALLKERCR